MMRPIDYSKQLWDNQQNQINELASSLGLMGQSYLRLREMIPGAFNTPKAPSAEDVYRITEEALRKFIRENINERE